MFISIPPFETNSTFASVCQNIIQSSFLKSQGHSDIDPMKVILCIIVDPFIFPWLLSSNWYYWILFFSNKGKIKMITVLSNKGEIKMITRTLVFKKTGRKYKKCQEINPQFLTLFQLSKTKKMIITLRKQSSFNHRLQLWYICACSRSLCA